MGVFHIKRHPKNIQTRPSLEIDKLSDYFSLPSSPFDPFLIFISLPLLAISRNDTTSRERENCAFLDVYTTTSYLFCAHITDSSSDGGHSPHNHRLSSLNCHTKIEKCKIMCENVVRCCIFNCSRYYFPNGLQISSFFLSINHWQFQLREVFFKDIFSRHFSCILQDKRIESLIFIFFYFFHIWNLWGYYRLLNYLPSMMQKEIFLPLFLLSLSIIMLRVLCFELLFTC